MRISYKDYFSSKVVEKTLESVVNGNSYSYDSGAVEAAGHKAQAAIEFTEKVVDMLYAKGLIADKDISKLVADMSYCDPDTVKIVTQ